MTITQQPASWDCSGDERVRLAQAYLACANQAARPPTISQCNGVAMVQCDVVVSWLFIHGWKGGGVVVIMLCEVP